MSVAEKVKQLIADQLGKSVEEITEEKEVVKDLGADSLDVVEILKAYYETGFKGYLRPDHGRMIWGETGKPGYGLYDRALGAMYMAGIWATLEKGATQ